MEIVSNTLEKLSINEPKVLIIEPFYGGSHKDFIINLTEALTENGTHYTLVTLAAKKWHWRARCGALQLYDQIPRISTESVLFCSSVLNLAELLGLRPDLSKLKKIVYFHENQLVYPVQHIKERDIQFAYNEITTSLAADKLLFNSDFNRTSFLNNIGKIIKFLPDNRPTGVRDRIEKKSEVLYFPVKFPQNITSERGSILHVVWPHRWEFDKAPDDFFQVLLRLKQDKLQFRLSVLGETYTDVPDIFKRAKEELHDEIIHFGYLDSKDDYVKALSSSHVVASTAKHEFFGVSVLEAVYCGCFPLVPDRLVYPEIYPLDSLYADLDELYKKLKQFCLQPSLAIKMRAKFDIDFERFSKDVLMPKYMEVLEVNKK